jgi:hypothetical protein
MLLLFTGASSKNDLYNGSGVMGDKSPKNKEKRKKKQASKQEQKKAPTVSSVTKP